MLESVIRTDQPLYFGFKPASSFLPDDIQIELIRLREQFKKGYFEIGDIAAMTIETLAKMGSRVTNDQVYAEIAKFCGKSPRTVRYYYETAVFYPLQIRNKYDALPFSHFVLARSMGDWERVLEYAQEHPYISEDALRSKFMEVPQIVTDTVTPENDDFSWVKPQPTEQTKKLNKHRYYQAISDMRSGMAVVQELMQTMTPQERMSYGDLLMEMDQAIAYLYTLIEKMN